MRSLEFCHGLAAEEDAPGLSAASASVSCLLTFSFDTEFARKSGVLSDACEAAGAVLVFERHANRSVSSFWRADGPDEFDVLDEEAIALCTAVAVGALPGATLLRASSASLARVGR